MAETYEIKETLVKLPPAKEGGFHLEVNLISWHGNEPKIDIRRWTEDRSKMTKGITLTEEEYQAIIDAAQK